MTKIQKQMNEDVENIRCMIRGVLTANLFAIKTPEIRELFQLQNEKLEEKEKEVAELEAQAEDAPTSDDYSELENQIENLEESVATLESEAKDKDEKIEELENKIKFMGKEIEEYIETVAGLQSGMGVH